MLLKAAMELQQLSKNKCVGQALWGLRLIANYLAKLVYRTL